jgi:hypothetical protein
MVIGPVWLMQPIPYFGEKIKGNWIYEPKIDGWRMQILRYPKGQVEFWGRRLGDNFKNAWKEAVKICKKCDKGVLLSQRYFYEAIYKPRRDELAKKWTEESDTEV